MENDLEAHISKLLQKRMGIIGISGAVIFLFLGITDYFLTPSHFRSFVAYRVIIASLLIFLYFLNRLKTSRGYQYSILIIAIVLSVLTAEFIILSSGGHRSPYFSGLILMVLLVLGFLPLNVRLSCAVIIIVYFIYLFPILIFDKITNVPYFIRNNFIMASIFLTAFAWRFIDQRSIINVFKLRRELAEETKKLEISVGKEQKFVRELSILNEMMDSISSELKFDTMIQTFIEQTRVLIKAEQSFIFIFEGAQKNLAMFKSTVGGYFSTDDSKKMLKGPLKEFINIQNPLRINSPTDELQTGHIAAKNMLILPLASIDTRLSALLFIVNKNGGFTEADEDSLVNFSFQVFHAIALRKEITTLAVTDGLTGLYNYRTFQDRLSEEIERAKRYNRHFILMMLDIDDFKSFNDIHGHQAGDTVLKELATILRCKTRNVDFVARYGGEEFMMILPEAPREEAWSIAERLRLSIVDQPFTIESGVAVMVTVSIGTVCFPQDGSVKEDLLRRVDQALYFAKEHGRNMICNYSDTLAGMIDKKPEELTNILNDPTLAGINELAKAVDARSTYMRGHSFEVAAYAILIAKGLQLDNSMIEGLRIAGLLHDIGNVAIPMGVLNKPGPLSEEEKKIIKGHPGHAEMLLKKYYHTEDILPAILYHHERYDGKGYPLGMKGDEIPLSARILSVAEAFQAMISTRPHRERRKLEEAVEELKENSGTQFDPDVVEAFIKKIKEQNSSLDCLT